MPNTYMDIQKYFNLILAALPKGIDPMIFSNAFLPHEWEKRPRQAMAHALRRCPQLDWQAYLANNEDVANTDADPVEHFLKNGIFEGRKLYARNTAGNALPRAEMDYPKVSVVIYNFNNASYLDKCVGSLICQTMQDIEIIVADDCSTDNSLEILHHLQGIDQRVIVLESGSTKGIRASHKAAVKIASGKFIIFMDSRDFLSCQACELAYNAITKGYEIVSYRINYLPSNDFLGISNTDKYGMGNLTDDAGAVLQRSSMQDPRARINITFQLYDSIYCSSLCKRIFADLPETCGNYLQDINESIILKINSCKISHLNETIYTYLSKIRNSAIMAMKNEIKELRRYLEEKGFNEYWQLLKQVFLPPLVKEWLHDKDKSHITKLFDVLAGETGVYELLEFIINRHGTAYELVANQFQYYKSNSSAIKPPKTIGILYSVLGNGGAERVIIDLANSLVKRAYNVVLFLEYPHDNDRKLPQEVKIAYLSPKWCSTFQWKTHLMSLGRSLQQNPVDIMLFHECIFGFLLWHTMLVKYMRIPIFFFCHSPFYRLACPGHELTPQARDAIFRCCDKLIILSPYEELYFRMNGVDAQYIPNPVRMPNKNELINDDFAMRRNNIIVFSRLGEPVKNIDGTLQVLSEIVKVKPWIKMTFVGSFVDEKKRESFYALASKLGIRNNIHVTGWVQDARPFIDTAAVLLSCSYLEAFPLTVSESQARGLPVVMNNLPIAAAEDNESIIRVAHNDYRAIAGEILDILDNEARWRRLSFIARKNASQYSGENYLKGVEKLLTTYTSQSEVRYYRPEDYITVMKALDFYGANMPPWMEKKSQS